MRTVTLDKADSDLKAIILRTISDRDETVIFFFKRRRGCCA